MDPLLVITNSDAGTADEENLEAALDVLRAGASVEVAATSTPGSWTASCTAPVPAASSSPAATGACTR